VTFEWRMLLTVAVRLLAPPAAEERERRSAINRAYYAAYGEAREYSLTHGLNVGSGGQSHDRVWQFLRRGAGYSQIWERAASKAIGDMGVELRTLRVQADYFRTGSPSEADARRAVSLANLIIKRILGLP
jgi:uncharacterized protein (UPF0332 family)